ncbi:hypothetical protein [Nocardiopsis sp. FIRDI 009]|uniref:hypothetical protein n=1 Tax=Nocardiopsis sp. FIRDI 009 TaxID=714197 RepID=UPI000E26A371|nr:hypothetical protein [Nocardiopsis sp. FIRDI 009]
MHATAAATLAVLLLTVGITHFLLPSYFRTLVPAWMPFPGALVAVSGAAELAVGAAILLPGSRAAGAWAAAALLTAYLVSHLDALRVADRAAPRLIDRPCGAVARLAVNAVHIAWAVAVAVTAG